MPAIMVCPVCEFHGNHGFSLAGLYIGVHFHHIVKDGICSYIIGDDENIYYDSLTAFLCQCPEEEQKTNWGKARIAELSGHPRIARKFYNKWKEEW